MQLQGSMVMRNVYAGRIMYTTSIPMRRPKCSVHSNSIQHNSTIISCTIRGTFTRLPFYIIASKYKFESTHESMSVIMAVTHCPYMIGDKALLVNTVLVYAKLVSSNSVKRCHPPQCFSCNGLLFV